MAKDRIQPLKLEDPSTGGTELDFFPTAADSNEDYVDCRGITIQDSDSDDETVFIERTEDGDMSFTDQKTSILLSAFGTAVFDDVVFDVAGGLVYDVAGLIVRKI